MKHGRNTDKSHDSSRLSLCSPDPCFIRVSSVALCVLCGSFFDAARADDGQVPIFALRSADGTTATGPLSKIADDWTMRLGGTRPVLVEGTDVISLRRNAAPLP